MADDELKDPRRVPLIEKFVEIWGDQVGSSTTWAFLWLGDVDRLERLMADPFAARTGLGLVEYAEDIWTLCGSLSRHTTECTNNFRKGLHGTLRQSGAPASERRRSGSLNTFSLEANQPTMPPQLLAQPSPASQTLLNSEKRKPSDDGADPQDSKKQKLLPKNLTRSNPIKTAVCSLHFLLELLLIILSVMHEIWVSALLRNANQPKLHTYIRLRCEMTRPIARSLKDFGG